MTENISLQDLKNLTNQELLLRAKDEVRLETAATLKILHTLREIDRRRAYAAERYPSLFDFCVDYLGYKKGAAYRRILAMQALKALPEIEEKIQSGTLNLTSLAQAQSYFKEKVRENSPLKIEEKREVVKDLENKSTRQIDEYFLKLSPKPLVKEKIRPLDLENDLWQVTLPLRVKEKILKLRSLLGPDGTNLENIEILEKALDLAIKTTIKTTAVKVSAPGKTLVINSDAKLQSNSNPKTNLRVIPAALKHLIWQRDHGQCTYSNEVTGERCIAVTHLELDHVVPIALGGTSTQENLRLLCRSHNTLAAIRIFGLEKMDKYINGD